MDESQIKLEMDKIMAGTTRYNAGAHAVMLQELGEYIITVFNRQVFKDARNIAEELRIEMQAIQLENNKIKEFINTNNKALDRKKEIEEDHSKLLPVLAEIETLQQKVKDLEKGTAEITRERDELTEDCNSKITKIEAIRVDLGRITSKHEGVMDTFRAHHFENEKIYGALKEREGVYRYVEQLGKEISDRLQRYDDEIKIIVEKRDQLPIYQLEETKKYQ